VPTTTADEADGGGGVGMPLSKSEEEVDRWFRASDSSAPSAAAAVPVVKSSRIITCSGDGSVRVQSVLAASRPRDNMTPCAVALSVTGGLAHACDPVQRDPFFVGLAVPWGPRDRFNALVGSSVPLGDITLPPAVRSGTDGSGQGSPGRPGAARAGPLVRGGANPNSTPYPIPNPSPIPNPDRPHKYYHKHSSDDGGDDGAHSPPRWPHQPAEPQGFGAARGGVRSAAASPSRVSKRSSIGEPPAAAASLRWDATFEENVAGAAADAASILRSWSAPGGLAETYGEWAHLEPTLWPVPEATVHLKSLEATLFQEQHEGRPSLGYSDEFSVGVFQYLARHYRLFPPADAADEAAARVALCRENAGVAAAGSLPAIAKVWESLAIMFESAGPGDGAGWALCEEIFSGAMQSIIEAFAEKGDVQHAVIVAVVLGQGQQEQGADGGGDGGDGAAAAIPSVIAPERLQEWMYAYIDILRRLHLSEQATELIKRAPPGSKIRALNEVSTSISTSCGACRRAAPSLGQHCGKCGANVSSCVLCHQTVRGRFLWCPGCAHGGHAKCMQDWFDVHDVCPSGCGHRCDLRSGVDLAQMLALNTGSAAVSLIPGSDRSSA